MVRNTPQMDEMRAELRRLKAQTENELRLVNDFQLQKTTLEGYWNIEKERRDELNRQYRHLQKQLGDLEEKHEFNLKVYKQKLKHLLQEQQAGSTSVHIQAQQALQLLQGGHREQQQDLKADANLLKGFRRSMELSHAEQLQAIRQEQEKRTMLARQEHERKAAELKASYEKKMKSVRDMYEDKRKADSAAVEQRKNKHVADLMAKHQRAFDDIKNYYRDITTANLERIRILKHEVNSMQAAESTVLSEVHKLKRKYKQLDDPLKTNSALIDKLDGDLEQHEKEKKQLARARMDLLTLEEKTRNADWEIEIARQQADQLKQERDELRSSLDSKIFALQQKSGFRNMLLEKKIEGMSEDLEKTESALAEILASTNLPAAIVGDIHHNLEEVLMAKNKQVVRLDEMLTQLKQKYAATVRAYQTKLVERDIPVANLGFEPVLFS